ncbi:MAG TPA: proline--tRNA ligase [Patescibacteria group bacterium]|nr:proline--tRNA ligase [Patescibacteria group bacterium]
MRVSQLFGRTSKTEGVDYKIASHRLLTQGGFIRESTAGRYYFLPLGLAVQNKIIEVVRRHMEAVGAQEVVTPVLHPHELWEETGRAETGDLPLMRIKDQRDAMFILGGTAEEMVTELVRKFNISYKDLPFTLYQFSNKFRDELRARGGLLRVREFIMKDGYSYGTEEQFKETYQKMWDAYLAIFEELGLKALPVASDNGYIGGEYCHEFIVESEVGESKFFATSDGSYAAHEDIAKFQKYQGQSDEDPRPYQEVEGKDIIGVEELAKFLNIPVEKTTKTILFETEKGQVVAAVINGLYDINEVKLMNILGCSKLQLASAETVKHVTGAKVGYAGFLSLPDDVRIVMDESVGGRKNFECGANKTDYHSINVNFGRDFPEPEKFYDIALAKEGYLAPDGQQKLVEKKGIEVGNIFQLGYHYSNLMQGAEYTDESGQRQKYYMGCYGIGIGRTLATIVEACHDSKGIIWPENVAPYKVYITSIGKKPEVIEAADNLYKDLTNSGVAVLYDDRVDARVGEKFADADLLGFPYRVVVSEKTLATNQLEIKKRTDVDAQMCSQDNVIKMVV